MTTEKQFQYVMTRAEFEQIEKDVADFVKKYGRGPLKKGRGRPNTGLHDAIRLAIEVDERCQAGMTRAKAVKAVAEATGKSEAHISLCHTRVAEEDLDRLDKRRERMAARARERKLSSTNARAREPTLEELMAREGRRYSGK